MADDYAISGWELEKITIPATVEKMGMHHFSNLKEYVVEDGSLYYTAIDGVLYSADKAVLCECPRQKAAEAFEIPYGVKAVEYIEVYNDVLTLNAVVTNNTSDLLEGYIWQNMMIRVYCSMFQRQKYPQKEKRNGMIL